MKKNQLYQPEVEWKLTREPKEIGTMDTMYKMMSKAIPAGLKMYILRLMFAQLHAKIDGITSADRQELIDNVNLRVGIKNNTVRKIESASLEIIVTAAQAAFDVVKL